MSSSAASSVEVVPGDALATLKNCEGVYECPTDAAGKRLGPLVGYAGTYGEENLHFVGDLFYNLGAAEEFQCVSDAFGKELTDKYEDFEWEDLALNVDHVLAAPMGGIVIGANLARWLDVRFGFAEKKIISLATAGSREESKLVLGRHQIQHGADVAIVEDLVNNFSTTAKMRALIEAAGGKLTAIFCQINRSEETEWEGVPVISLAHLPTRQYQQDDPAVAEDIANGNVVWKPKNEWGRIMAIMNANR